MKRVQRYLAVILTVLLLTGTVSLPVLGQDPGTGGDTFGGNAAGQEEIVEAPAVDAAAGQEEIVEAPAVDAEAGQEGIVEAPAVDAEAGQEENLETPAAESVSTSAADGSEVVYTVTLNANGGGYFVDTANGGAHTATWVHTGKEDEIIYNWLYEKPTGNPGKVFSGWSRSANGSILPDSGYKLTGNLTLYAIWTQGCAITLDAAGGYFTENGSRVSTVVTTVEKGRKINTFSFGAVESPTAEGKRFRGYSLKKGGSVEDLLPDLGHEVQTNTLTLYAVWSNICTITYHTAGGGYFTDLSSGTGQYASYSEPLDEGDKVNNYSFIHLVPNEGNNFQGWSLQEGSSQVLPSSGYQVGTGTLDLYAVWESGNITTPEVDDDPPAGQGSTEDPEQPGQTETCVLTFSANGGRFARAGRVYPTIKENELDKGTKVSLYDTSLFGGADPTRSGAVFQGWSLSADSTDLIPPARAEAFAVTGDLTVYAVWETTITFDANGGTFAGGQTTAVEKVLLGSSVTVDLGTYAKKPERAGFDFLGWAEWDEAEKPMTESEASAYVLEGSTNCAGFVYAVWSEKGNIETPEIEIPDDQGGKIRDAEITLAKTSLPYNGTAQTPAVTVVYGENKQTLTEGTDYTVTYSNNISAGTASVVITGAGKFTGSVTKTFKITRIAQALTLKADASTVETGKTVKVTAAGAKETTAYTFTSSKTSVAAVSGQGASGTVTGKSAGTVTITVTTPQTANYKESTASVTIRVLSAALTKPKNCGFVKWKNSSYTKCLIRWEKVADADGYQTLLTWTDGSHAVYSNVKAGTLEKTCEVLPNHVSQFKVRAYVETDSGRKYGPWSNLTYITPSPTTLKVKKEGTTSASRKAKISWNIIYGCNGYNVFVTTNPYGKWYWNQSTDVKAGSTSATITSYRGGKLKKGQRYYVRIVTRRKRNGVFCTVPMPKASTYVGSFKF